MTCNKFLNLAAQLAIDGNDAPLNQHRATCPACQAHERAAREQYTRKPANWQTIALRPVCSPPCTPADYGGFGFCGVCGRVEVWEVTK